MRTAHQIQNNFSPDLLEHYKKTITATQEAVRLSTAMKILNIKENKFIDVPFKKDKIAFLRYKVWLGHFELSPGKYPEMWQENLLQLKILMQQAEQIIAASIEQHRDTYSPFAQGLSILHQRKGKHAPAAENSLDGILASVVIVGKKTGGIEPGFIAAHHEDLIEYLLAEYAGREKDLLAHIDEVHGRIDLLLEQYKDKLPKYMYKMDYHTDEREIHIRGRTVVYLTEEDVKRTSNVQNAYKIMSFVGDLAARGYVIAKQSTSAAINSDALKETLANDFASIFMPVQEQKLYLTEYPNRDKKFMPCSRWVEGASEFGSKKNPLIDGYACRKLVQPHAGIHYISEDRIQHLPRYYLLLLLTGDYDKIGSLGQNLLKIPGKTDERTGKQSWTLVGIDFGHTFREKSRILKSLLADGRFEQPGSMPFKNFSALTDGALREKMEGVLILAKLAGKIFPEAIINSFGADFKQVYERIQPREGERICENYCHTLDNLSSGDYDNHKVYMDLKKDVENFRKIMSEDLEDFVKVFSNYLGLDARIIDLVDNLNLFSAGCMKKTRLRSENGQTLLRHMQIKADYRQLWTVSLNPDNHCYRLEYQNPSREILENLQKIFTEQKLFYCSLNLENTVLVLDFHESYLPLIQERFNEQAVQKIIHPEEFAAITTAKSELLLQDLIKAPWFLKNQLQLDLCPYNGKYRLVIRINAEQDDLTVLLLEKLDLKFSPAGCLEMIFGVEKLPELVEKLSGIPQAYENFLSPKMDPKPLKSLPVKEEPCLEEEEIVRPMNPMEISAASRIVESVPEHGFSVIRPEPLPENLPLPDAASSLCLSEKPEESDAFCLMNTEDSALEILLKYYQVHQSEKEGRSEGDSLSHWWLWASTRVCDTYSYYANPCASVSLQVTLKQYLYPEDGKEADIEKLLALLTARKEHIEKNPEMSLYKKEFPLLNLAIAELQSAFSLNMSM